MASLLGGALVLLVTCGNVAMLLLGRSVLRRHDAAVRRALGAGSWRLARTALAESLILALAGTALGTWLASLGLGLVRSLGHQLVSGTIPRLAEIAIDGPILLASAATVTLVAALCGIAPAAHAAGRDPAPRAAGSGYHRATRSACAFGAGRDADCRLGRAARRRPAPRPNRLPPACRGPGHRSHAHPRRRAGAGRWNARGRRGRSTVRRGGHRAASPRCRRSRSPASGAVCPPTASLSRSSCVGAPRPATRG